MNPQQPIGYAGICFTPDRVLELDGQRTVAAVPRADIWTVRLCYGVRAKHPLLLAVLGFTVLGVGLYQVPLVAEWFLHGGVLHEVQVGLLVNIFLGGWILWQACSRGYLLVIDTRGGRQTLEFASVAMRPELERFLVAVESCFAYTIEREAFRHTDSGSSK